jgi:hypothetical protein
MACNATRIELSNSAVTTLTVTLTTDPGDGATVLLIVDGLGITTSGTTSGGSATLTPVAAVVADTNSIWDAIIQVGTNRPAVAEVLVTETNTAQSLGITITDSQVTYCAPSGGGGGGADWELLQGGLGQTLVVPSPIGRRIAMQQTYPDSTPDFRDGVDVMMNGSFDRASAGTLSSAARIARLNDLSYPAGHQWGADLATLIGWYDLDTDLDNCVVSDLVGTGVWLHYDVEYPYGMRDPVKLADDLLAENDISTPVADLDYNGTSADEVLLRQQWQLVCDGHLRRLMARRLLMPGTPVGFHGLFSGDPKGQRAEMKLKYDMYKAFMERTVTDLYGGVTYTFKAADVLDAALPYCYGILGDGFHWSSIWDSQTEQNLNLNRMTQEPYDVFRWYLPWLFTQIDCPLRLFPLLTYEQSRDDVAIGSAREAAGCPSGWTNAVLEAQVEFAAQSSGIVDRIPAFLYWCGDSTVGSGLNLTESKAMVEDVAAIREGRYTGGFINYRAAIDTDLTIQAIADADATGRRISEGESGLLNPIPVAAPGSGTVSSVNGEVGAVVLTGDEIDTSASSGTTIKSAIDTLNLIAVGNAQAIAQLDLDALTDVNAPTPSNGEVLQFDQATGKWVPAGVGGTGTVTSVGLNVPGGFTVVGTNPITSSGTFEITSTLSGVIKADGAATFSGSAELNDLADVNVAQGAGNDGDLVFYDHAAGAGAKFKGVARSSIALSEFNNDLPAVQDSYLMLIESPTDKTYVIDGRVAAGRTVTNFYAKTSTGTCTATLKNVTDTTTIGTISVTSTGGSAASLTNTSVTENERLSIEISSNSSSADLELVVEYTQ